ncbi:DUF4271 domain-containing protein [Mangrovimonas spongiae]|uniref:DUF4271 domain-containing protein n=1 Tax=Mangrovimonas spongiae TaxID=2494697 RepID=A0A428K5W9_9FLAO|nr:DUF4271 domain-containing protein [Mangrovimonas spongiae]RSK41838.1 DUF4271 domain-containing protein [Mangrovimonas spongiae]
MIRQVVTYDIFTVLIVIGLLLVALSKVFFERRFKDFTYVFINSTYLKVYEKDQRFFDLFDGLLFTNLVLGLTTFCCIALNYFNDTFEISYNIVLKLIIGIAIFFIFKTLLERLIASLFEIDNILDAYLFQKISYKNFLGLLLIPINIILLFGITPSRYAIYITIIILLLVNVVGLVTTYKSNQNLIKQNMFYFILYLCTLEIGPFLILYKTIIDY